jgi:hypothetical protein
MVMQKVPSRDIVLQVHDGASTWLSIAGINSVTYNPGEDEAETDITSFDSDGQAEHRKMQRGATMAAQGMLVLDSVSGALDPGQARCEALMVLVDEASVGMIRFRHPTQTTWKQWNCTVSPGEQGGGNNDETSMGYTFKRTGPTTLVGV